MPPPFPPPGPPPPAAPPLPRDYAPDIGSYNITLDKDGQCSTPPLLLSLIDIIAVTCDEVGKFFLKAIYRAGELQQFIVEINTEMWQGPCDVLDVTSESVAKLDLAVNPLTTTVFKMTVKDEDGAPLNTGVNVDIAIKNANALQVGPGVHSLFLSDEMYKYPSQLIASAEGDRVRLEHTAASTCAGYSGGAATCKATYAADSASHITIFGSSEITTIALNIGVLLPGVPLCPTSLSGYDSSVKYGFESPLGCPIFDDFASITNTLVESTNTTPAALEVVSASCGEIDQPALGRRLMASAAAQVALVFHTNSVDEAEKIVALLPPDESTLAPALDVPISPGSLKIKITSPKAPSRSLPLTELLAGAGCLAGVIIACAAVPAIRRRRQLLVLAILRRRQLATTTAPVFAMGNLHV